MKRLFLAAALVFGGFQPALAGDPVAGEAEWRQCRACHMIVAPNGDTVQRGGRVGPNLYGVVGRRAGSVDGFRYQGGLAAAGAAGLVWSEATLAEYLQNPGGFLQSNLGDATARSGMNAQMSSGAADMAAYLARFN